MTLHDLYLLSPYLATAGAGILVILLDLMVRQKGLLVGVALAGVLLAAALVLVQTLDTGGSLGRAGLANLVPQASVLAGSLLVDRYALFFGFLVLAALGLVVLASVDYLRRMPGHQGEYLGLLLFSATGMMLLAAATELITIYIALELTTLPLAALASFLLTGRSTEAGMKYLVIGAISSAVMLYGMALVFGFSGTTDLAGIAASFQAPAQQEVPFGSYAMLAGVALMLAGFGFKIATVPFQMWVPDVYEGAPATIVA
ncbi:MAG TPA: proton-conducting transporter membrane subunit, partial [Dehalococcoidia bacterium]|nr:proton-conducting transporter membrane subunit [Dehalococcoidia bacterium]